MSLKEQYQNLVNEIISKLIQEIEESKVTSHHMEVNCITVNVFDYEELIYWEGELVFLDGNGHHYSLFADCELEDLIDILEERKKPMKRSFTEEEVSEMLLKAFKAGETWGVTYGGWFTPSEEEKETKASESCNEILNDLK